MFEKLIPIAAKYEDIEFRLSPPRRRPIPLCIRRLSRNTII